MSMEPNASPVAAVSRSAWALLLFLTLLNILNFVDRMLITALAPFLRAELGLSKAQIGLLAGFGFVFFYTFVGLFLGLAADRFKRIPLVAGGLALWSGMTALSGFANSFLHLALPRIFVGVGEATLTPSALSMLGDAFPQRRLAMATGVYYAGIPIGTAVGLIASRYIAPQFGWRACFFILGAAGLVAAGFLFLFREPARRAGASSSAQAHPTLRQLVRDLAQALKGRTNLVLTLLGGSLLCYGAGAALHALLWLVEERGYTFEQAAIRAGGIAVFAGFLGNLAGGAFGDWCARRRPNGHLWSLIPMTAFFVPVGLLFYNLPPGTPLFYVCWFITSAGTSAWFGPLFAAIQEQSPAHTRASTVAFALLVLNLLGVGPGPLITGMIGDAVNLSTGLLVSLGVVALAIVPFWLAVRKIPPPTFAPEGGQTA
jgi:predicted MFS family arabinose efflux permease